MRLPITNILNEVAMSEILDSLDYAKSIFAKKLNEVQRKLDNLKDAKNRMKPSDQFIQVGIDGKLHKLSLEKMEKELESSYKQIDEYRNDIEEIERITQKKKEVDILFKAADEALKQAKSSESIRALTKVNEKITAAKKQIIELENTIAELENKKAKLADEYDAAINTIILDRSIDQNNFSDEIKEKSVVIKKYPADRKSISDQINDSKRKLKEVEKQLNELISEARKTLKKYDISFNIEQRDDEVPNKIQDHIKQTLEPFELKRNEAKKKLDEVDARANTVIVKAIIIGVFGGATLASFSLIAASAILSITVAGALAYGGYKLYQNRNHFFSKLNHHTDKKPDDKCSFPRPSHC